MKKKSIKVFEMHFYGNSITTEKKIAFKNALFYRIFNQNGQSVKQKRHFYALIEGPKMNNFGWCALKMHTRNCLSFKQSSFFQFMKLDFIA